MQYDKTDRIERQDFLEQFGFQASTEKRARAMGLPWPPHVVLGKKIFYSRLTLQRWFEQQEAKAVGLVAEATADDQRSDEIRPQLAEADL